MRRTAPARRTRRQFLTQTAIIASGGAAGVLSVCPVGAAQSRPARLRAAAFERPNRSTKGAQGAERLLSEAGFEVRPFDPSTAPSPDAIDVLVLGSFVSESEAYKRFMAAHAKALAEFVRGGGVLLQFTQADQTEPAAPFLPDGLLARRCDEDVAPLRILVADHPLLRGLPTTRLTEESRDGEASGAAAPPDGLALVLPSYLGRPGNWESIAEFRGFRVLMAADAACRRPILMEAEHGRGRFILTSLYLDALHDPTGRLVAPQSYADAARAFFRNLHSHVGDVRAGRAEPVRATTPYRDPEPLAFMQGSFTLVALPDTQIYSESHPRHFHNQCDWILRNRDKLNIRYVLHLGDITNRNTPEQWEVASAALHKLDGHVPYALVPGNHDMGPGGAAGDRTTLLNDYFRAAECAKWPTFGGTREPGLLESSFHTFEAGGEKFLILALEWGPRNEVVTWANAIVARFPEHRAILVTHAYMYSDDTRYDWASKREKQSWNPHAYGTAKLPGGTNDGEELWSQLVRPHGNFLMTVNGHVLNDGLARLASRGARGNLVHQMLVNYQMKVEGGQGFLRLIEFLPDGRTVQVRAYSPSLDCFRTDEQNQFVLRLDPPLRLRT